MIAYTYWSERHGPWYVAQLPGQGGVDWGYTDKRSQALALSDYWFRRFATDQRRCGRQGFAEKTP